jgi:hypothetical protein
VDDKNCIRSYLYRIQIKLLYSYLCSLPVMRGNYILQKTYDYDSYDIRKKKFLVLCFVARKHIHVLFDLNKYLSHVHFYEIEISSKLMFTYNFS